MQPIIIHKRVHLRWTWRLLANSQTNQIADNRRTTDGQPNRRLVNSRTGKLVDNWTTHRLVTVPIFFYITDLNLNVGHRCTPMNASRFTIDRSSLMVTHPSINPGRRALTSVTFHAIALVATASSNFWEYIYIAYIDNSVSRARITLLATYR